MRLWRRPRSASEQLRRYVETHHIDMIPAGARHGKPWHQFAFWWGGNVNVFNVVLGAVVISIGLAFWWALIAIAAGTMIGALLIALHATQGPKLGVPQTIQCRAQFGFYGSAFLFPAVLLINVGFIAAQFVIQAQAMRGVIGVVTIPQWILILTVPAVVIGIFGYRWIHRVMQATAVVVGVSLVVMLVQGLRYGSLPAHEMSLARPPAGLFLAGVALLVIDMLSFGPFVSDYTRYLPAQTNGRRLFWAIYAGNVAATFFSCAVGAYLAALLPSLGPVAAVGRVSGSWALVVMAFSLVNAGTFNAYTGAFQVLAFANMWHRFKSASVTVRLIPFCCVMAAGVAVALRGLPVVRHQLVELPGRAAGAVHPLVGGQPGRLLHRPPRPLRRRRVLPPCRYLRQLRLAGPAGLCGGAGRGMAVRVPAGLHRAAGPHSRRRRHLLAGRLVHRRRGLPGGHAGRRRQRSRQRPGGGGTASRGELTGAGEHQDTGVVTNGQPGHHHWLRAAATGGAAGPDGRGACPGRRIRHPARDRAGPGRGAGPRRHGGAGRRPGRAGAGGVMR